MRVCRVCGVEKHLSEFHKKSSFEDGIDNRCKDCTNEYNRKYHKDHIDHQRAGLRKRRLNPKSREYQKKYYNSHKDLNKGNNLKAVNKYQNNNKEKRNAHTILNNRIREGVIKRLPCEICGKENAQGHHDNYSKPLDVRWLCRKHHMEYHRGVRYGK